VSEEPTKTPLELAREAAAKRAESRQVAAEKRELERLELEAKYEAELGPLGVAFTVVGTPVGAIFLKLNDTVLHKALKVAVGKLGKDELLSDDTMLRYVKPSLLYPSLERFSAITQAHDEVLGRCVLAVQSLHDAREDVTTGK
jgi:hypothetical protein